MLEGGFEEVGMPETEDQSRGEESLPVVMCPWRYQPKTLTVVPSSRNDLCHLRLLRINFVVTAEQARTKSFSGSFCILQSICH